MRAVPDIALSFVKAHEGCKLTAYRDVAGCATVGFGHTGPEVVPSQTISQALADIYLREDLDIAARRLAKMVDEAVILKLTDHQYAALLSFVFNLGTPPGATLWKVLNDQKLDRVPLQMMRWIYAGGKPVQGLVNRRAAEVELWRTPDDTGGASASGRVEEAMPAVVVPFPAKPLSLLGKIRRLLA